MIRHVFTKYAPKDQDTRRRNAIAQRTWARQPWLEVGVEDEALPRLWREKGRAFPYLSDVFDAAAVGAGEDDLLVYTNADIHVRSDLSDRLELLFQQTEAAYAYRRDFARLYAPLEDAKYATGKAYVGSDLAACTVRWWKLHGHKLEGMVIGGEAWDPMFRQLADETNPGRVTVLADVIGHERHRSYWEQPSNRYTLAMQRHNVRRAFQFFAQRGIDPANRWIGLEGFVPDGSVEEGPLLDLIVLGLGVDAVEITRAVANLEATLRGSFKCFVCAPPGALRQLRAENRDNVLTVNQPRNLPRHRYQRLATLRNRVLRVYRNSGLRARALLWIDMDCYGFWNATEAVERLLAREDWDAVAAYGLRRVVTSGHDIETARVQIHGEDWTYYDWLAFENEASERVLWHSRGASVWHPHGTIPANVKLTNGTVPDVKGQRVHSAFGPACFYRPEAIHGLWYDEQTRECEHQGFHRAMRERGQDRLFISEDVIALYENP